MREKNGKEDEKGPLPRVEYRHAYLTEDALAPIYAAYQALTGRRVFDGVRKLLVLNARVHGPDLIPLMGDLHAQHGVDDLLKRLLNYPPRPVPPSQQATTAGLPDRADADNASASRPDEATFTRVQEIAWRVAEMRPQNDQGAHPRERKARVGRVPADSGDRSPREDQREIDDLWEGWLHPLPGSVVEAVDTKPRRPNRPGRP